MICEDTPPPADIFDAQKMRMGQELLQSSTRFANFFPACKVCGQVLAGDQSDLLWH